MKKSRNPLRRARFALVVQFASGAAMIVALAFRLDAVEFQVKSTELRDFGVGGLTFFSAARAGRIVVFGAVLATLLAAVQLGIDVIGIRQRLTGLVLTALGTALAAVVAFYAYRIGFANDAEEISTRPGWGGIIVLGASALYASAGLVRWYNLKALEGDQPAVPSHPAN